MQDDANTSSSLTHNTLWHNKRFISLSGDPCKMTQTQAVHWLTTHCDTTKIHITIRWPMQNDVNTSSSLTHNTLWHNKDSYQVTHARWHKHKQFIDSQHTVTQQRFISLSGDPCKMTQTQAVHWLTTHCDTTKIHITIRWPMQDDANTSSSLTHNTLWHNKDSYHYQVTNAKWRKHKQFTDSQQTDTTKIHITIRWPMQDDANTSSSLTHNTLWHNKDSYHYQATNAKWRKHKQFTDSQQTDTTKIHITIRWPMQDDANTSSSLTHNTLWHNKDAIRWPMQDDVNTSSSLTHNTLWHNKDSYQVTHARWRKHKQFTDSQHTVTQQRFISLSGDQCKMTQTQAVHWLTTHCDTTKIHITIRWPMQDDANTSSSLTDNDSMRCPELWHLH